METKICSKCGIEKPLDQFYKHGFNSKGEQTYRSDCKECQRQYDKKRTSLVKNFANAQKLKCAKCGSTSKLHYHHIDPDTKAFTIGRARHYSLETIQQEIDKCVVLCAHCHKQYHWLAEKGITIEQYLE